MRSEFTGGVFGLLGMYILAMLLTIFTLGIGTPWAICMMKRWYAKHTFIEGRQLRFDGTGLGLLGRFLLWWLVGILLIGGMIVLLIVVIMGDGGFTLSSGTDIDMADAGNMFGLWVAGFALVVMLYSLWLTIRMAKWATRFLRFN
ncbi:MAG: YjgN family protein [Firmicutes bacterium]|nr:YjgN family protein [Bacillota bacterium]